MSKLLFSVVSRIIAVKRILILTAVAIFFGILTAVAIFFGILTAVAIFFSISAYNELTLVKPPFKLLKPSRYLSKLLFSVVSGIIAVKRILILTAVAIFFGILTAVAIFFSISAYNELTLVKPPFKLLKPSRYLSKLLFSVVSRIIAVKRILILTAVAIFFGILTAVAIFFSISAYNELTLVKQ